MQQNFYAFSLNMENVFQLLAVLIFGWPAILLALSLSVAGILQKKPSFLVAGSVIAIPFFLYLAATPRFRWIALVFPLLLFGASIAVRRSHLWLAWSLFIPVAGFVGWMAAVLINE